MSQINQQEEDLAFERLLLAAGRTEAMPPEQTQAALLRFAAGIAALPGLTGSATSGGPTTGGSDGSWARLVAPAKWASLGFIAGGVAMLGWLGYEPRAVESPTPPMVPIAMVPPAVAPITPAASAQAERPVQASSAPQSAPARAMRPARDPTLDALALRSAGSGSDLAAEVAALDGIRTALSIGAWRDAEKQSDAYRRAFPQGALRSEAEVLAIEGLLAQGRKQAAVAAGERFISSHPRDPQVARMRALIESP